ncbi:MAG: Uma2 family endonuclease [Cyanobacteria bacterium QS_8_64_29]|nr:MAG: Uma2 family endonuclease [Cyanobacteria bacterium QS_8_64_29]
MPAIEIPERFQLTPEQFDRLAPANETVRLELTATGELLVMPPTGFETGGRNARITAQLATWADRDGTGRVVDSSTLFALPNGARRSPDAAWISNQRIAALTQKQRQGIPPLVPDLVVELASPSDLAIQRYADLQTKMQEYIDNGTQLGWLIEPETQRVEIYRPGQQASILEAPQTLSGEDILPGFELDLSAIWSR